MAFWFGRKSAPETRPFVPAWLAGEGEAAGFVRGVEGARVLDRTSGKMVVRGVEGARVLDRTSGKMVVRRGSTWEPGILRASEVQVDGNVVLRERQAAIANPSGGSVSDVECRTAVDAVLAAMRAHGLIG